MCIATYNSSSTKDSIYISSLYRVFRNPTSTCFQLKQFIFLPLLFVQSHKFSRFFWIFFQFLKTRLSVKNYLRILKKTIYISSCLLMLFIQGVEH